MSDHEPLAAKFPRPVEAGMESLVEELAAIHPCATSVVILSGANVIESFPLSQWYQDNITRLTSLTDHLIAEISINLRLESILTMHTTCRDLRGLCEEALKSSFILAKHMFATGRLNCRMDVGWNIGNLSEFWRNNANVAIEAVQCHHLNLSKIGIGCKENEELVLAAVRTFGNLRFATSSMQNNKTVVLASIARAPLSLHYASIVLKRDLDVVGKAVEKLAFHYSAIQ